MATKTENMDRADVVRDMLLRQYRSFDSYDDEVDAVTDLLANIRHYCDVNDIDFATCDRRAYAHYTEEI